ncbi:MAG TPA: YkgJ family cysteine cluster protein [Gemmatimonadales bacterium]|nr:YkgJ family cysteine cluster protein [Gemmatimonadales bacterium]
MSALAGKYRALLGRLDDWTLQVRERNPGVIPCARGCTACCHGPFDVSAADVVLLLSGFASLPDDQRRQVLAQAKHLTARIAFVEPAWRAPYDVGELGESRFDALTMALADEPCPFLQQGSCSIYVDRPLVCRVMGLGLLTPDDQCLPNACPIQADFPEYLALPPQRFDLAGLEREEKPCLAEAGRELFGHESAESYETTIATALMHFAHPVTEAGAC